MCECLEQEGVVSVVALLSAFVPFSYGSADMPNCTTKGHELPGGPCGYGTCFLKCCYGGKGVDCKKVNDGVI